MRHAEPVIRKVGEIGKALAFHAQYFTMHTHIFSRSRAHVLSALFFVLAAFVSPRAAGEAPAEEAAAENPAALETPEAAQIPQFPSSQAAPAVDLERACWSSTQTGLFNDTSCLQALQQESNGFDNNALKARLNALLAFGYAKNKERERASAHLEAAFALSPNDPYVTSAAAVVQLYSGQFAAARATIDRLLNDLPRQSPTLWLNRSLASRGLGDFETAARDYENYLLLQDEAATGSR